MEKAKVEKEIWEVKVQKSIEIFSVIQNDIHNSILNMNDKISNIELKTKELTKALETINSTGDINVSLFSPYENVQRKQEVSNIKNELLEIQRELPVLNSQLTNLCKKQDEYQVVSDCLHYLKSVLDNQQDIEEDINGNTDNMEINVNNLYESNSNYIGVKILETQELERQRIARDLHDSTIQNLTNLMYKTELCIKLLDMDTIRVRLELATLINQIRCTINDMRDIIYDLRPMSIQDLGLVPAIERFAKKCMEQNHIQVTVSSTEKIPCILSIINLTLYRIIQEACNNIVKYANASICSITLNRNDKEIKLVIEDNGVGMQLEEIENKEASDSSGFGLSIMRERALLLSGSFEIESTKGKGTKITVIIPYREQEEECNGTDKNCNS